MYPAYEEGAQSFQEFRIWNAGAATLTGSGDPEQMATVTMSDGVLPALGVRPYLGRWFSKKDDTLGATAGGRQLKLSSVFVSATSGPQF